MTCVLAGLLQCHPLLRLRHGSRTFTHIQAVAQDSEQGMDSVLLFVNSLLAGDMPDWPALKACRLVPLAKGGNKIRPIAVGEVCLRVTAKTCNGRVCRCGP